MQVQAYSLVEFRLCRALIRFRLTSVERGRARSAGVIPGAMLTRVWTCRGSHVSCRAARLAPRGPADACCSRRSNPRRYTAQLTNPECLASTPGIGSSAPGRYIDRMSPTVNEIRQKVATLMSRRGVVRASIFGSVARGEATETSDVDFLVEFERGRTLVDLAGLRLDLCEALGRDVDVATPGSLHPKLRDRILGELVPVL